MRHGPIAKAIVRYAEDNGIESYDVTDFRVEPGNGLSGRLKYYPDATDPYTDKGEPVQEPKETVVVGGSREFITGFTGSAGTAVIFREAQQTPHTDVWPSVLLSYTASVLLICKCI